MRDLITWWSRDVRDVAPQAPAEEVVARIGEDLVGRWNEPVRRYHTTRHLLEMFAALENLEDAGEIAERQGSLARVAAWFHDAVYDPSAPPGANEAESAALARHTLQRLDFEADDVDAIERLILLTARHDTNGAEELDAAFSDADLWILASSTERFDQYCDQVRQEYAHVPEAAYQQGRAAVLRPLLRRDRIYRTAQALRTWEAPARVNLSRELKRLHVDP
jgi:predicted metal-dependent HD superfamily phosphohydrolase